MIRCATKLGANKFSDVAEGTGHLYNQVAIACSSLIVVRVQVD